METVTIRLPDVEAAMLVKVQKVNKDYRDLQSLLMSQIQQEYLKAPNGRVLRWNSCQQELNVDETTIFKAWLNARKSHLISSCFKGWLE